MSSAISCSGKAPVACEELSLGIGRELVGQAVVHRQKQLDALLSCLLECSLGDLNLVGFHQRFAGRLTHRVQEGVRHPASDQQRVGLVQHRVDDVDLARDL